jgi:hypothetical protein
MSKEYRHEQRKEACRLAGGAQHPAAVQASRRGRRSELQRLANSGSVAVNRRDLAHPTASAKAGR